MGGRYTYVHPRESTIAFTGDYTRELQTPKPFFFLSATYIRVNAKI